MSNKIKKTSGDLSFSLSRWLRKVSTNAPSSFIVTLTGLAYAIFLFGGGLYTLIGPDAAAHQPSAYVNGRFFFLYPDISHQFISDTLISVILYALGFVGLLMVYQSSKSAYKPRQAYMMLVVGVTFLLLAYLFLEGSIGFKATGGQSF
jgi:hypothetical protein